MLENYNDVLTVDDIMQILKIGRNAAYDLVHSGELYVLPLGRKIRVPKQVMIDFLTSKSYNKITNIDRTPADRKGAY